MTQSEMYVVKRDGQHEPVFFDKITKRLQTLIREFKLTHTDAVLVTQHVIGGLYAGVRTSEIDNLAVETCMSFTTRHPQYGTLASVLAISNHHKLTSESFVDTMLSIDIICPTLKQLMSKHKDRLDSMIVHDRDYQYDYFGFKTMQRSYLLKKDDVIVERPQYVLMRVACELYLRDEDFDSLQHTYDTISTLKYTHATPTLFNSCVESNQLASCFLMCIKDDSIDGIFDTVKTCALISKHAGGIGLAIHEVRSAGSRIRGTNGYSNGIVPMLKTFEATARYVDQGGGKRKGSIAIYLEPWHPDIYEFLEMRKNNGKEELRARDLFYALWIPDLFMKRVIEDGVWSLFDPSTVQYSLSNLYGDEFEQAYITYENAKLYNRQVSARDLFRAILVSQIETGTPFMLYKDQCNRCSNQNNLGVLKSSNLCTEILEYTDSNTIAVCNLASINLSSMVKQEQYPHGHVETVFDYDELGRVVRTVVYNLNRVIDTSYHSISESKDSNTRNRPIGIGVQGLADVFFKMGYPFTSEQAQQMNHTIFEYIYYHALSASHELALRDGAYTTFSSSMLAKGKFHFEIFGRPESPMRFPLSLDWETLRGKVIRDGVRNSLLVALMPTASTSQILGNYESFEPMGSNIMVRSVLAGEFVMVNKYLVSYLESLGMWNESTKNQIVQHDGSVQSLTIPDHTKELFKTVWELPQRVLVDMAIDRGFFVDQSQSFNVYMKDPSMSKLFSLHKYSWERGAKTGCYYLRTRAATDAVKFSITSSEPVGMCRLNDPSCQSCSS